MYSFQICEFIVVGIHADTEEQASISPVDNLVVAELGESEYTGANDEGPSQRAHLNEV
jgi:hypothetical protein